MTQLIFFKKEMLQLFKTFKLVVVAAVFVIFAMLSPLAAKYINEIIKAIGEVNIVLPEPQLRDAYLQFFKNNYTISIIAMVLVFMSTVVEEKIKGSMHLMLTKGISRSNFIISKFLAASIAFLSAYILSFLFYIYYTYVLFKDWNMDHLWICLVLFASYGLLMIAWTLLSSTIAKSFTSAALGSFIAFGTMILSQYIPKIGKYMPGNSNKIISQIIMGSNNVNDGIIVSIISLGMTVIIISISVFIFKRQEI